MDLCAGKTRIRVSTCNFTYENEQERNAGEESISM